MSLTFHLTNIVNKDSEHNFFSKNAEAPILRSLYKRNHRDKIQNYSPVSTLNGFPKIYQQNLLDSPSGFLGKTLSSFIAVYRKSYSSNHVLKRLIGNWKKQQKHKKT